MAAGASIAVNALTKVLAGLFAAHALRAKQATNENSAMNLGVAGFDQDLSTVLTAYNSGAIDANGAIQAANQSLTNYWALVTPHIQPGRNGCSGGTGCGPVVGGPPGHGGCTSGQIACTGTIGAACCVGCNDIKASWANVIWAMQNGGGTVNICAVDASKYGGVARAGYSVNVSKGGSLGSVGSAIDQTANELGITNLTGGASLTQALGLGTDPVTGKSQITSTFVLILLGIAGLIVAVRKG